MGYTPTTWNTGDTITASALNKIEQGIAEGGGGAVIVNEEDGGVLDKTFAEIYNLLKSGTPVYIKLLYEADGYSTDYECYVLLASIFMARKYDTNYVVYARSFNEGQVSGDYFCSSPSVSTYRASNASGYPVFRKFVFPTNVSTGE